ncbi:hypothetical protein KQI82_11370 [Oscillibacter sp. MSJ-2]|uniref:DUF4309 domain-containing protein n=1 Tax=Dysosmobacter acutus TaxID=2841504 RepID=A0ABS6FB46_9FIRM|nr:hypothetical protein [Dysosmobacter acutus]MBU5627509.1 hypothetical protein [Dysosmobacter acutus]
MYRRIGAMLLAAVLCAGATACGSDRQGDTSRQEPSVSRQEPDASLNEPDVSRQEPAEGDLLETERLGELRYNQTEDEVEELLGEPAGRTEPEYWGSDGLTHTQWSYDGVELSFAEGILESAAVTEPFAGKTQAGIAVGDSAEAVREAYGGWIDEESSTEERIVAGDVYGGLIFTLKDDSVVRITLGVTAE